MKFSFFKALAVALFDKLEPAQRTKNKLASLHRKLKQEKKLQSMAQALGNQRRIDAWLKSVQGGYEAKRQLVAFGKGRNTLAGIPA